MPRVVVGLGSNMGDRVAHLRAAAAHIGALAPGVRASSVYESAPVGGPAQDDFLNAALLFDWADDLHALLDALQRIERERGRDRALESRWGPRALDLDVLWAEDVAIATPRLEIPHPRLHERAFALLPLLELVPAAHDARTGASLAAIAAAERAQPARPRVIKLAIDFA
jgi:2-amino-4-hydroxy-6-hydroxymethyldihydropteridine diphosphokinase